MPKKKKRYVIETKLPDGYHWFTGIGEHPETIKINEQRRAIGMPAISIPMNSWSPYIDDVMYFPTHADAQRIKDAYLSQVEGLDIFSEENSHLSQAFKTPEDYHKYISN